MPKVKALSISFFFLNHQKNTNRLAGKHTEFSYVSILQYSLFTYQTAENLCQTSKICCSRKKNTSNSRLTQSVSHSH